MEIIKIGLDLFGDELREKAMGRNVRDPWLRNVRKYLEALQDDEVENLLVQTTTAAGVHAVDYNKVLNNVEQIIAAEDMRAKNKDLEGQEEEDIIEDEPDPVEDVVDLTNDRLLLTPRSYRYFYSKRLVGGMRLWHRPPHNHCKRCADYLKKSARMNELNVALLSTSDSAEYEEHQAIVGRAGGSVKGWEEVRTLQQQLPDLKKHVDWSNTARGYLKKLRTEMPRTTVEWQLDYGGLTDSEGKKVSVWSATVVSSERPQEHFDFFFDQSPNKGAEPSGTAKKDGLTGKFMLGEMLDPEKSPNNDGVSLFARFYPDVTDIVLTGDTGNGYRGYDMLQELSCVMRKYGYKVELIPLAPGHAWNRTDARIAHMNTFLNVLLQTSRVFGAEGIAKEMRAISDPRLRGTRKFMARSHIFFVVVKVDRAEATKEKKRLGAPLISPLLHGGKMGVRGFLYFDFSVIGADKQVAYVPGYARTREHAAPDRPDNPTYVWTWRTDLILTICQPCSDSWGGPVLLTTNGCTKKKCSIVEELKQKQLREQEERERDAAIMPLQRDQQLSEHEQKQVTSECEQAVPLVKNKAMQHHRKELRQVRAVHGMGANGKMEIWLYVPEYLKDKSNAQRRGWWLHQVKGRPRHYYIGRLADIQATKKKRVFPDVAVFNNFPFTRSVQQTEDGREIDNTVICVTDRPLTDEELKKAKGGEDVNEVHNTDEEAVSEDVKRPMKQKKKQTSARRSKRTKC